MPEQQKRGLLRRLGERWQARRQRALDKTYREHDGGSARGGRRKDGFKEGVPDVYNKGGF